MDHKHTIEVHGSIPSRSDSEKALLYGIIVGGSLDGKDIRTSPVQSIVFIDGQWYATTLNSTYRLLFKSQDVLNFIQGKHFDLFVSVF